MPSFSQDVTDAVAHHMNTDHPEDNLVIVRGHSTPDADAAQLLTLDSDGGTWSIHTPRGDETVTIAWPDGPISERPDIRRAIVTLYRSGCATLGIAPREH